MKATFIFSVLLASIIAFSSAFYVTRASTNPLGSTTSSSKRRNGDISMNFLDFPSRLGMVMNTRSSMPASNINGIFELVDAMNQVLEPMPMSMSTMSAPRAMSTQMSIDVRETDKSYDLMADLPGVSQEDVKIDIKDRVLTISTERSLSKETTSEGEATTTKTQASQQASKSTSQKEEAIETPESKLSQPTWRRVERYHGHWSRTLTLPRDANEDSIEATLDNGVLTITIPKLESPVEETKRVPIKALSSSSPGGGNQPQIQKK